MTAATDIFLAMRWSWLSNPVVALLGLLASVVTIGQWIISAARLVHGITEAEEKRRHVSIWIALTCLVAVAVISPLSWPVIMMEAAKIGNGGVLGALYPVTVNGLSASSALVLLLDAKDGRRFSVIPGCCVILGLAFATGLYVSSGAPGWGRYAAAAVPAVAVTMLPLIMLSRVPAARPRSQ
jgi:hypothetical protein